MTEAPAWVPSEQLLAESNVARFTARHGFDRYEHLVAAWRDDPAWFWQAAVADMDIAWLQPPEAILDVSAGVEFARWFTGGAFDLSWACVSRHPPNRLALVAEDEAGDVQEVTYGELDTLVGRLAGAASRAGVGPGDRVGLLMPLIPEACAVFYACARLGAICVPLFTGFGPEALRTRLTLAEVRLLFTVDGFRRRGKVVDVGRTAREAARQVPSLELVVTKHLVDPPDDWTAENEVEWEAFLESGTDPAHVAGFDGNQPFLLAFTSGTTGAPKGVVHGQAPFAAKVASEAFYHFDFRSGERLLWVTDVGWIMAPLTLIGVGAVAGTLVLYSGAVDTPHPRRLWEVVDRHAVSALGVSPSLVRAQIELLGREADIGDIGSLRILASTGEPWTQEAWWWYFDTVGRCRLPIINICGGTEAGSILGAVPVRPLLPCSFNSPCVGVTPAVRDGELAVVQPWPGKALGFWRDESRYLETYWSRWPGIWRHGDLVRVDADGNWFVEGRADDTLLVAGKRVGPGELEDILLTHPDVTDAAVVGLPHPIKGEAIWGYCVLRAETAETDELAEALAELVASRLGRAYRPAGIEFLPSLPRTKSGKVVRRALRAAASGTDPGDLSVVDDRTAIELVARRRNDEQAVLERG